MNARRINLILWTTSAVLGTGAVVAVVGALAVPLEAPPAATARDTPRMTSAAPEGAAALQPLESFQSVWSAPLRRRLGKPVAGGAQSAAEEQATTAPVTQALPVTLVGTVGHSLALLRRQDNGTVDVRSVGERFGEIEVIAVRPHQVDLRFQGNRVTLKKPVEDQPVKTRRAPGVK